MRLLATPVQPLFVFDGPHKPTVKRNKRSGRGNGAATAQAKQLCRLFGFAVHDAPGEAEAECALLQRHGVVDAVLSEDVDTIMFGCTKTLRNWSSASKTAKTPTHVSLYDVQDPAIAELGLDREGMVLIALMSGGDYLPGGIPGCGVKVACEAAKAGYGKSICTLKASNSDGIQSWKRSLADQLRTNEKGHFRVKHKALTIPESFPDLEVLRYYTHPAVSQQSTVDAVRQALDAKRHVHLDALREFTRETFGWDFRIGATKFIRVLGQALLVHNICQANPGSRDLVKNISGRRHHSSTDATPELRLSYVPQEVVPIDLSKEVEETFDHGRDGLALNSDDDFGTATDAAKTAKVFDVAKPDLAWVLEDVARRFIPETVQAWEDATAAKAAQKPAAKTAAASKQKQRTAALGDSGMPRGALDGFVRMTKARPRAEGDAVEAAAPKSAKGKQRAKLDAGMPCGALDGFFGTTKARPAAEGGAASAAASSKPPPSSKSPLPLPPPSSKPPPPPPPRPEPVGHPRRPSGKHSPRSPDGPGLPATPRRARTAPEQPETILVSSSPAAAALPCPPPRPRVPGARGVGLPGGAVRAGHVARASPPLVAEAPRRAQRSLGEYAGLDRARRAATPEPDAVGDSSELEPLASLIAQAAAASPGKQQPRGEAPSPGRAASPVPSPSRKKRPSAWAARVRWSDVSIVDLTGD